MQSRMAEEVSFTPEPLALIASLMSIGGFVAPKNPGRKRLDLC